MIPINHTLEVSTKHEQANGLISKTDRAYRFLFENTLNGLAYCKMDFDHGCPQDFTYLDVNRAFETLTGLKNVVGKKVSEVIPGIKEADAELFKVYGRVALTGQPEQLETYVASLDMWFSIAVSSPKKDYFVAAFDVITGRKKAEEALRESEERFRVIFQRSTLGKSLTAPDNKLLEVNQAFADLLGYTIEEMQQFDFATITHPMDVEKSKECIRCLLANEQTQYRMEKRYIHKNGTVVWADVSTMLLRNKTGSPLYFITSIADITERKQTEDELNALYNALSDLFNAENVLGLGQQITEAVVREFGTVDCGLLLVDEPQNRMIRLARAGKYKIDTDALLVLDGPGLVPEVVRNRKPLYVPDARLDTRYLPNDSRTRSELVIPLETSHGVIGVLDLQSPEAAAFSDRDQRILSVFAERATSALENAHLYEEVNRYAGELEWRVAERTAQLQESKEKVEAILNNSSDAIIIIGIDSTILNTNPAFNQLFGYQSDQVFKQNLMLLFEPEEMDNIQEAIRLAFGGQPTDRLEFTARRSDGAAFHADTSFSPIRQQGDDIGGIICSVRDITARRRMEDDLRAALAKEKELSELKSNFVSMVSHEFRTPLAAILSSSDLVMHYGDRMSDEKKRDHLATIRNQVQQLARLLEDVLVLGKAESVGLELHPTLLNLEETCQKYIEEVQHTILIPHQIVLTISQELSTNMLVDEKLLRHILSNLLTNAMKYSPEGSRVHLDMSCADGRTIISVRDEGIGIPLDDQPRVFEIFQRGKNVGNISGTGLGLAIIKRAVNAYGGTVSFESVEGVGTTFTVTIPISQERIATQ